MSVKIIEELEVYNRAEKFSDDIWFEVATWKDYFAKDTIGKQILLVLPIRSVQTSPKALADSITRKIRTSAISAAVLLLRPKPG